MTAHQWAAFLGVVALAYAVPGPDALIILRRSAVSRRDGILTALGAQTGLSMHMLLAVTGISAVLAAHPSALATIRILGGIYLIGIGVRLVAHALRHQTQHSDPETNARNCGGRNAYLQGLLTNVTNPKAILFFAAVLPQFINPDHPAAPQVLLLGIVDIAVGLIPWAIVAVLGDHLGRYQRSARATRRTDTVSGTAITALGAAITVGKF